MQAGLFQVTVRNGKVLLRIATDTSDKASLDDIQTTLHEQDIDYVPERLLFIYERAVGRFEELCDIALTETINRSMTNSFTIIFMLTALVLMGGETIKWFIVALLIGTVSGTYSSPFIATPVLLLWDRWEKKKRSSQ